MEQKEQTSPSSGTNLFDPSKTSPIPGSNLFDPGALLGASPFAAGLSALPFAHLAHLPGAFSMLGHPAFPVSSLFGSLGDGLTNPLGLPTSLVSSASPSLGKFGLFDASLAFTTPSSKSVTSASGSSGSSRISSSGSSRSRKCSSSSTSRGRPKKLVKQPAIPLSLVQSTSILSPSMLEKYSKKRENSTSNGFDSEAYSDRSSVSSLFDVNFDKDSKSKKPISPPSKLDNRDSSSSPQRDNHSRSHHLSSESPPPDGVHNIDSLKRKLIADQIRQRVQTKPSSSSPTSSESSRKRRGRPPRISQEDDEETRFKEELALALKRSNTQEETGASRFKGSSSSGEKGGKKCGSSRRRSANKVDQESVPIPDDLIASCELKINSTFDEQKSIESYNDDMKLLSSTKLKDIYHDSTSNGSSALDSNEMENGIYTDSDLDTGDTDSDEPSGSKRKANDEDGDRQIKRRHVVLDDSKIRIPLAKGWKRQTNIHSYGKRGIVGEVWYFAPCGRKFKTIPEVMRYIERNNITDLSRDLFSFNTKVKVGDFYEARVGDGDNGFVKLNDTEIEERLSVTVSRRLKKIENQKKREKLKMQQIMAKQLLENKMKQKLEQQGWFLQIEMARKVAEMQFQKRLEREQQKEMLKRAKQMKLLEKKKQREQMRIMRERERQQRDEQLRAKQEMRAHLLIEEREMKRQQVAMLKEQMRLRQEQERRRQHMLLLKALEQRKKQEERERQKEEKIAERRMHRERKNEQRKMEFVLAQELKKPREDMELRDSKAMPEFPRIPGNHLDGEAFADCLMSLEFIHNFAKPLGFDSQTLPSMKSLHDAVTAKTEDDSEEYMSLVTHLLRHALDEPGVPNPKEAVTKLGQKITDIEITDVILSEVLRVFMVVRNGGETELSEYLRNCPLEACSINQRAAVIAFLCNELNCGKTITMEIENHLDHMADIRRDKWVVEGKLRRLRTLRSKKFNKVSKPLVLDGEGDDSVMTSISKQSDDDDDKDDNSGNEDEHFNEGETEEDDPTTLEECEKQIDKLRKTHFQYRDKVFKESQHVRGIELGRDRYKRNYWVLPHAGGIYIEGMESGEIKELVRAKVKSDKSESKNIKIEVIDERTEKKGVAFLEEVEEKKAVEILSVKSESQCIDEKKVKIEDKDNESKNEKRDVVIVKEEKKEMKHDVKNEVKSEFTESVKVENIKEEVNEISDSMDEKMESKLEKGNDGLPITNGHIDNGMKDDHIKTVNTKVVNGIDTKPDIIYNGNLNLSDQKSPQHKSVSGMKETGSNLSSSKQTGDCESSTKQTGSSLSTSEQTATSPSFNIETKKSSSGHETSLGKPSSKHVELKIPNIKSSAIDKDKPNGIDISSNLFLQIPQSTKLSDFCSFSIDAAMKNDLPESTKSSETSCMTSSLILNTSFSDHVTKSTNHKASLLSPPQPPPAHSKMQASERKPSFMSIDSILEKKTGSSQSNNIYLNSTLPVNPFVNSSMRNMSDNHLLSDSKPWFSLLPRIPCDDMSLTRDQHTSLGSGIMLSPPFMSQMPFQPFSLQSPSFSSFQMGQLFTTSVNHSQTVTSSSTATVSSVTQSNEASFKKPEPVSSSSQNPDPEQVLKSIQGEAKPIPEEFTKGWWKVSDSEMIEELQKCLHPRGIREKELQKTVQKYKDHTLALCSKTKDVLLMESSSEEEDTDDEEETEQNDQDNEKEQEKEHENKEHEKDNDNKEQSDKDLNDKTDENESNTEVEMEIDGTEKSTTATTDDEHTNCDDDDDNKAENTDEKTETSEANQDNVVKKPEKGKPGRKKKIKKEKPIKKKRKKKKAIPVIDCNARSDEADRLILEEVETLEDRIASASLQIKGWKLAPKTFSDESEIRIIPRWETKKDDNDMYPVEAAKERLLQLESNVERRYLKPPLSKAHRISLNSMSSSSHLDTYDDNDSEVDFENLPVGLQMWRIAVATATSPAQLMLCVIQLNNSLAWEKSIMKVLCQICRKDDNEAELLLCDGCDRGYHTYCFKPKLESIPDGDWYCFECVSKAVGESCCLICGKRFGKMAECNLCNRCVHIDCLDPPLPRVPRKWFCASCDDCTKSSAKKRVRKNSNVSSSAVSAPSTPAPDLTPTGRKRRSDFGVPRKRKTSDTTSENDSPVKKSEDNVVNISKFVDIHEDKSTDTSISDKEKMKSEEQSTDLKICKSILTEMMKHEDGWPFLQPVNCKHFPSYRKYIKQPMDFGTMKIRLRDHMYQTRNEFMTDAILVFDNCRLFNEDDSEVGQCGHNMRKYFNRRWKELVFESMAESLT